MTTFPPSTPPQTGTPQKSSGCWKWGACGCLTATLIVIAGIAGIALILFGMIKSTEVYRGARLTAENDPRVIAALGAPVHAGFWVVGTAHFDNGEGRVNIRFPLIGSRGRGLVHVVGTESDGKLRYSELTVEPRSGPTIDLLSP